MVKNMLGNMDYNEAFRYFVNSIEDLVYIMKVDTDGFRCVLANNAAINNLKVEGDIIGKNMKEVHNEELLKKLVPHYQHVATTKEPLKFEAKYYLGDEEYVGEIFLTPIVNEAMCDYIIAVVRDITEKWKHYSELKKLEKNIQANEKLLKLQKEQYQSLFINHPDAILLFNSDGVIESVNASAEQMLGYSHEQIIGTSYKDWLFGNDMEIANYHFESCMSLKRAVSYEVMYSNHKSNEVNLAITNIPIIVDDKIEGVFGTARDISELKSQQETLAKMAYYDYLTGLSNRRLFDECLAITIKKASLASKSVALMMLDGEGFKIINDTFGHDAGDKVIKESARRIQAAVRDGDVVSRLGGDELGIILPDIESIEIVKKIASQIQLSFQTPMQYKDHEIKFRFCIGIALYPEHARRKEQLVKFADNALYKAKNCSCDFVIYSPAL